MSFVEKIQQFARQIEGQLPHILTEEATKNALVMPFIGTLGYNVFNPTEVTPELHADVGIKKGEKVDYAILKDGKPIILFECKWHGTDLAKEHASQLYRYFSVTEARFGVLTNGIRYRFFTDLDAPNKMDAKPFFEFNALSYKDEDVKELEKFSKESFDIENILETASELKYASEIRKILGRELQTPSEEFVKFFTSQVYQGRMTQAVKDRFAGITRRAFNQFINDEIAARVKSLINPETPPSEPSTLPQIEESLPKQAGQLIETTNEELEAFYTIRAILHGEVDGSRLVLRDVQSYCGVLLDDNNRKPICRLYFNRSRKTIGLFDSAGRVEQRLSIESVADLHQYGDRLKATVAAYTASTRRDVQEQMDSPDET